VNPADRAMALEVRVTLTEVARLCIDAAAADPAESLRLCRVARSQLDTCAFLLSRLARVNGMINTTAAAGRGSSLSILQRPLRRLREDERMAINDGSNPITDSGIPGVMYPSGTGAEGSAGGLPHAPGDGAHLGTAGLSPVLESVQGGRPSVDVGSLASQVSGTTLADGISGISETSAAWTAGSSHVAGPHHPNSANGGAP
jgi:hypothetical protein